MKHKPSIRFFAGTWCALHPYRLLFGNPMNGGYPDVRTLLKKMAEFNKRMAEQYGIPPIAWSAHLNAEVAVRKDHPAAEHNSPIAIDIDEWIEGAAAGKLAPVGRIVPKGFGYPWSDHGALRNDDPTVRAFHHNMMVTAFEYSEEAIAAKAGPGGVIYWDGPDSIDWRRLLTGEDLWLSYETVPTLIEWKRLVSGVGTALGEVVQKGLTKNGSVLLFEPKGGGDPGALGILMDSTLTFMAMDEVCEIAGISLDSGLVDYQPEGAHVRGEGERLSAALQRARRLNHWRGHVHFNTSPLARTPFSELLGRKPNGTRLSEFQPATDPDYNCWPCAIAEWVDDNVAAIREGARYSAASGKPFELEHDAKIGRGLTLAHSDAEREELTVHNLEVMTRWTWDTFNTQAVKVAEEPDEEVTVGQTNDDGPGEFAGE